MSIGVTDIVGINTLINVAYREQERPLSIVCVSLVSVVVFTYQISQHPDRRGEILRTTGEPEGDHVEVD